MENKKEEKESCSPQPKEKISFTVKLEQNDSVGFDGCGVHTHK